MTGRVRLSELADTVGVDFGDLFHEFAHLFPGHIDNDLSVPAAWLELLQRVDEWLPTLERRSA